MLLPPKKTKPTESKQNSRKPGDDNGMVVKMGSQVVKTPSANTGDVRDVGLNPGLGRSGGGHGSPLSYSCLENPMDRGSWLAIGHGSQRVGHDEATYHTNISICIH